MQGTHWDTSSTIIHNLHMPITSCLIRSHRNDHDVTTSSAKRQTNEHTWKVLYPVLPHNNTILQEQSHTGNNPLFQLIYDIQSRGTCTWHSNFHAYYQHKPVPTWPPYSTLTYTGMYIQQLVFYHNLLYLYSIQPNDITCFSTLCYRIS